MPASIREDVPETRYLLAYCYYWWDAFTRGYLFEVYIFGDLQHSGIEFVAHDIRDPIERRSRSDLVVLGREGDIKTSTYFLATARTQALWHDFYITRLYDAVQRRHLIAVMMNEAAWQEINGDTVIATLEEASSLFPQAIQVRYADILWIIVDYNVWKQQVKTQQQERNNDRPTH